MFFILTAIVVAAVIAAVLLWYSDGNPGGLGTIAGLFGFILAVVAGLSAVVYVFAGWSWFAADHKAQIINREYGANYTQAEVFWASDVIDTVRQLDRKRYEINGDLMCGKGAKP